MTGIGRYMLSELARQYAPGDDVPFDTFMRTLRLRAPRKAVGIKLDLGLVSGKLLSGSELLTRVRVKILKYYCICTLWSLCWVNRGDDRRKSFSFLNDGNGRECVTGYERAAGDGRTHRVMSSWNLRIAVNDVLVL